MPASETADTEAQLQREGIFLVKNCTIDPETQSAHSNSGRTALDLEVPLESLSAFSPDHTFDVIILKSGAHHISVC